MSVQQVIAFIVQKFDGPYYIVTKIMFFDKLLRYFVIDSLQIIRDHRQDRSINQYYKEKNFYDIFLKRLTIKQIHFRHIN